MKGFVEDYIDLRVPREGVIRTTISEIEYFSELVEGSIVVPVGLKTDLGSIPVVLQSIFPKDGKAVLAYILHDYLYKIGKYDRHTCDAILDEAMETLNVGLLTRKSVRSGLYLGGWVAWNGHRKNDIEPEEATY